METPNLVDIYARCLDVVQRVTYISSESHHGLTVEEFQWLEEIADKLLCLHCSINYRQTHISTSFGSEDDDDELPF